MTASDPPPRPLDPDPDEAALIAELQAEYAHDLIAADHPVRARNKRPWLMPLRLLLSAALVWFLVRRIADVSFADLLPEWSPATIAWLGVALALTGAGVVLAAARWKQVLVAMAMVSPPFSRLVTHYFAGQFVSNVLPTTIGGDVLRAARLANDTGDTADSFASLLIERLIGWLVLPLLTFAGLALDPRVRETGPAKVALLVACGSLTGLLVILALADHPRVGGRYAEREGWRRFLGSVHLGVNHLRRHPRSAVLVVVVGVAYQLVLVLAATAGARALGIAGVGLTTMLAIVPSVLMFQVLPLTIAGLGVREGALVFFLSPLGVPEEQAVALGLLAFTMNLVISLLGAPAFAAGSRPLADSSRPMADVDRPLASDDDPA